MGSFKWEARLHIWCAIAEVLPLKKEGKWVPQKLNMTIFIPCVIFSIFPQKSRIGGKVHIFFDIIEILFIFKKNYGVDFMNNSLGRKAIVCWLKEGKVIFRFLKYALNIKYFIEALTSTTADFMASFCRTLGAL